MNNKLSSMFQVETDNQNNDFKSHSLKNSESIRASKLQSNDDLNDRDDNSIKPPSGHVISRENILRPGGMVSQFDGINVSATNGLASGQVNQPYPNIKKADQQKMQRDEKNRPPKIDLSIQNENAIKIVD